MSSQVAAVAQTVPSLSAISFLPLFLVKTYVSCESLTFKIPSNSSKHEAGNEGNDVLLNKQPIVLSLTASRQLVESVNRNA